MECCRASERSERCKQTNVASDRVALSKRDPLRLETPPYPYRLVWCRPIYYFGNQEQPKLPSSAANSTCWITWPLSPTNLSSAPMDFSSKTTLRTVPVSTTASWPCCITFPVILDWWWCCCCCCRCCCRCCCCFKCWWWWKGWWWWCCVRVCLFVCLFVFLQYGRLWSFTW